MKDTLGKRHSKLVQRLISVIIGEQRSRKGKGYEGYIMDIEYSHTEVFTRMFLMIAWEFSPQQFMIYFEFRES